MEQVSENVMRKLAKIKALADNAGTEGEAMAAATLLNELLMKHKLEMSDIEQEQEIKEEPVNQYPVGSGVNYGNKENNWKWTYKEYPDVEIKKKRIEWSEDLARMISRTYGCSFMIVKGSSRIWFVGRKSNVAIVEYMYITMHRVVENLSWKEYKTARNKTKWEQIKNYPKELQSSVTVDYSQLDGYRSAWIDGFVQRVREMLREMEQKAQEDPTGTALIRIKSDALAVDDYLKDVKSMKPLGGQNRYNDKGYADGRSKANEVGLTASGMNKGKDAKQIGG